MKATKQDVINRFKEASKIAKREWNIDIKIDITYNLDSVNILGRYYSNKKVIDLNYKLLKEYGKTYIDEVALHEFAHAVVNLIFPSGYNGTKRVMPHGKEFKAVCSHFGTCGKATTSLFNDSKTIKKTKPTTRFSYSCDCGEDHQVTKIRHNKMLKGVKYRCTLCKGRLFKV